MSGVLSAEEGGLARQYGHWTLSKLGSLKHYIITDIYTAKNYMNYKSQM